jgi:hypothetical protein
MEILGYNGRGLIGMAAGRALLNLQKRSDPDVMFLSETHLDEWPAECLRRKLKMDFKEVVRRDGRSGGLLLLWKTEFKISLRFKTKNFIDVNVNHSSGFVWRFTGLYGELRWQANPLPSNRSLERSVFVGAERSRESASQFLFYHVVF